MNNRFRLFIINENTNFNYSITLHRISLYIMSIVFIIIIVLSTWGMFRFIKPHQNQQLINNAKSLQYNTYELLNTLSETHKIDSTILFNYQINNEMYNMSSILKPVSGIITKGLSKSNEPNHPGIDIAANLNSIVVAAQHGMIVFSDSYGDYGNTIIIAHPNNYYTLYSHLNNSKVNQREYVERGQIIGYIGESGKSNGPHLHFEIWKNHAIIDPRELIEEYKIKDVSIKENK